MSCCMWVASSPPNCFGQAIASHLRSPSLRVNSREKSHHRTVRQLFRRFEEAGERAHRAKKRIADEAIHELEVHTEIEEKVFYPAVQAKAKGELEDTVREGWEEHHVVDGIIAELKGL